MKSLKKRILNKFKYLKIGNKKGITIIDDIMPSNLSPWRSYEYSEICNAFESTKILTDTSTFVHYSSGKSYDENIKDLVSHYPKLDEKIKKIKFTSNLNSELTYFLFYNNLKKYFDVLNRNKNQYSMTLYPGGGFGFNDKTVDDNLKKYFDSNLFKGVIVNQNITKQYLIENQICNPIDINLVFGVPLNLISDEVINFEYKKDLKKTSIVFFANKYTNDGSDKGFDIFQKILLLLTHEKEMNFIVIGGFTENDICYSQLKGKIDFKGMLNENQFTSILKDTHILISPNKPFVLSKNAFDGFPLATCVTASLYGNVTLMTDYFNEADKIDLIDNQDFIKINTNVDEIVFKILKLHNDKNQLKKIALSGRNKMLHLYSFEKQIIPRINHFKKILS